MTILNDPWIINLRDSKQRKFMKFFKRKVKKVPIKRMEGCFLSPGEELTEQEYVDKEFKRVEESISNFQEKYELLEILISKEYVLIDPQDGMYRDYEYYSADESREWAKENDYSYIKYFKFHGELWVKENKSGKK